MNAEQIRLTGDRILVRPQENPKETESGLALVEDWKPECMGHVVSLAEGASEDLRTEVRPGDLAVFSWQDGQELVIDGERFLMFKARDILAIVE